MSVLTFDVALASKLKKAMAKNGWTEEDINLLAESSMLLEILEMVRWDGFHHPSVEEDARSLFEIVGNSICLPKHAGGGKFHARPHFALGNQGPVPIHHVDDLFRENFYDVRENVTGLTVRQRKLRKSEHDCYIICSLGDRDLGHIRKAKVDLQHVYQFLRVARRSEPKGYIFYVPGIWGVVWAVTAHWNRKDSGWDIGASTLLEECQWGEGYIVIAPCWLS